MAVTSINVVLLVFNMLPVYPLDGGQILRAVLWFFVGQAAIFIAQAIEPGRSAGRFRWHEPIRKLSFQI